MDIDGLEVYNMSMDIGYAGWNSLLKWDNFAKNAFGSQLLRSTDFNI